MNNPVKYSIGLISDTHYHDRLFELPTSLDKWWADVDLILHAGDVGKLEVLDLLGRIAPTIAVHGNDEVDEISRNLPERHLLALHGIRILLWHSHFPDPVAEQMNRKGAWRAKIERIERCGEEMNAQVVVYGHTHIPTVHTSNNILIINAGALAAGNYFLRQAVRSVAKLDILSNGLLKVSHFDVDTQKEITPADAKLDDEFDVLAGQYQKWIVEPAMIDTIGKLRKISFEDARAVAQAIAPLYQRSLQHGIMRSEDFHRAIDSNVQITPNDKRNILNILEGQ